MKKIFERGLSQRLNGLFVRKFETDFKAGDNRLGLGIDLSADKFGRHMQDRIFVVRPG